MTTLRSMPCGRDGFFFGSSPLAMRSVQSPKYLYGTPPNWPARRLVIISPACPACVRRIQASSPRSLPKRRRPGARGFLPELMTADAIDVVHLAEPVVLRDLLRDGTLAAKLARRRDLHHRVPVDRRIVMRGGGVVRCDDGHVAEPHAGLCAQLRRIHEPISTHPHFVICGRQIWNEIAALIVGDDDARELGRQFGRFCNP